MTEDSFSALADRCWRVLEPIHAVTYFMPESAEGATGAGLKGYWMAYFGMRAAPMGAVPASVVEATFYNFHRSRVSRAIPDAWAFCPPDKLVEVRSRAAAESIRRVCEASGVGLEEAVLSEMLNILSDAVAACDCAGRTLAAANKALSLPHDPVQALWQLVTVLREHRGDGHIACLTHAGLDGAEALVMHAASGAVTPDVLQASRNWPDDEWAAAEARLAQRGLLSAGSATAAGSAMRSGIEADTNQLASHPYERIGRERTLRLLELILPVARSAARSGELPSVNPIGLDLASG